MLRNLTSKTVRDRTPATLAVAGILLFFAAFAISVYASIGDQAFALVEELPDAIAVFYGTNDGTPAGLVTGAMFSLTAPIVLLAYAISSGVNAATGEEKRKTLDLLLSSPVSRTRVIVTKTLVMLIAILLICGLLWVGTEFVSAVTGLDTSRQDLFAACVQMSGLGLMFAGLALALGAWSTPAIAAGATGAVAGASYLATTLFPIDPGLEPLARFTPWYLYSGQDPLHSGVDPIGLAVMLVLTALGVVVAVRGFNRRDLRG